MNKKGDVFLYGFILIAIALLGTLAFVIQTHENRRLEEIPVGQQAGNLLKLYGEGEKIQFYSEQFSKLAKQTAIKKQFANGGDYKNCKVSLGTDLVEWTSCSKINLYESFLGYYGEELKKQKYHSTYSNKKLKGLYEQKVNNLSILDGYPRVQENSIITKYSVLILHPEYNNQFDQNISYFLNIQTKVDPSEDFKHLKEIYQIVSICIDTDNPLGNCEKNLKTAGANVTVKDPLLDVRFDLLKFSINTEKELPALLMRSL